MQSAETRRTLHTHTHTHTHTTKALLRFCCAFMFGVAPCCMAFAESEGCYPHNGKPEVVCAYYEIKCKKNEYPYWKYTNEYGNPRYDLKCGKCNSDDFKTEHKGMICVGKEQKYKGNEIAKAYKPCLNTVPSKDGMSCEVAEDGNGNSVIVVDKSQAGTYFLLLNNNSIRYKTCKWNTKAEVIETFGSDDTTIGSNGLFGFDSSDKVIKQKVFCPGSKLKDDSYKDKIKNGKFFGIQKASSWIDPADPTDTHWLSDGDTLKCSKGYFIPNGYSSCQLCKTYNWNEYNEDPNCGCYGEISVLTTNLPAKTHICAPGNKSCAKWNQDRSDCATTNCNNKELLIDGKCVAKCSSDEHANDSHTQCIKNNSSSNDSDSSSDFQYFELPQQQTYNIQVPIKFNTSFNLLQVKCDKGELWFNQKCVPCASNQAWIEFANEWRVYCAGGEWGIGTPTLKQLTKCPRGSWPNDKLNGCDCAYGGTMKNGKCEGMKLSKKDLYYGPQGAAAPLHKQCWTKTSDDAYKVCMGFDN